MNKPNSVDRTPVHAIVSTTLFLKESDMREPVRGRYFNLKGDCMKNDDHSGLNEAGDALRSLFLEIVYSLRVDRLCVWLTRKIRQWV